MGNSICEDAPVTKLLIIGRTGQLGSALIEDATVWGCQVYAPDRKELDISDRAAFTDAVESFRPDFVINTAAYHDLPACEREPAKAFEINCLAVNRMADICRQNGAWFISFSTDYVFDGAKKQPYLETDIPDPLQIYGISKLAGEYAAFSRAPESSIIIRTCGLYGLKGSSSKGGNFVDNRILDARRGSRIEISSDQTVSPTFAGDLSIAVMQLMMGQSRSPGIYHLVNQGYCTWYQFTAEIFRILDIKTEVIPVDRHGRSDDFRRPLFSALDNRKAAGLGINLPNWKDALRTYLTIKYLNTGPGAKA